MLPTSAAPRCSRPCPEPRANASLSRWASAAGKGGASESGVKRRWPCGVTRGTRESVAAIDMRGHSTEREVCRGRHPPLAKVTISDYYMTMIGIRIADLKSRLSEHLRKVRAGSSLTILDRDTPIARIVPWKAGKGSLKVRAPLPGAPKLQRVPLPPPLRLRGDVVKLLLEERQGDR
jgi:antitoxin (DNA-binding transcriptional repressor) of toxin-antitoxin stability system